jgi:hypothetical protein
MFGVSHVPYRCTCEQFPVDWSALDSDARRKAWGSRGADGVTVTATVNRLKHPYEIGAYSSSAEHVPAPAALLPRHYLSEHSEGQHSRYERLANFM